MNNSCSLGHEQVLACFSHSNEKFVWLKTWAGFSLLYTQ